MTQAQALYEDILKSQPAHFEALHLLGVIASQTKNHSLAVELIGKAISICPDNANFHSNLGIALYELNQPDAAVASYDKAIAINSDHAEAHCNRGVALYALHQFAAAVDSFNKAIALRPEYAEACSNCGNALKALGELNAAVASYGKAIAIRPDYTEALFNRGVVLNELGLFDAAVKSYDKAIAIRPGHAEAFCSRGIALQELRQFDAAIESFNKAITIRPDYTDAYYNRGNVFKELQQLDAAVESYDRAILMQSEAADAYCNRGAALKELGRLDAAIESYDRAIAINPDFMEAHYNRGIALQELDRFEAAVSSYDKAIAIKPDHADAHSNRGNALKELRQFEAAVDSYNKAIAINPGYAEAHSNLGNALKDLRQLGAAVESYDKAIALKPDFANAYWNKSLALLAAENFAEGWELYEWRWKNENNRIAHKRIAMDWDGNASRCSLLVLPEQGIGDEIFYSGMLNDLKSRVSSTTVCVDPRLVKLYQRSFEKMTFATWSALGPDRRFDRQVYLGSLGRFFRNSASTFKDVKVPYLRACPARAQQLRSQTDHGRKLICGLSWISKNNVVGKDKSMALKDLRPILCLPHMEFVDLQYGDSGAEQAELRAITGFSLKRMPEIDNFNDIDGLAALIDACDIVVTVSNTTAHLAAALGKPVFVMLPYSAGSPWYWHMNRNDSPWYPGVRLIRPAGMGDWNSVIECTRAELQRLAS